MNLLVDILQNISRAIDKIRIFFKFCYYFLICILKKNIIIKLRKFNNKNNEIKTSNFNQKV